MKVKLLTSGGFMGISNAPHFKWDTLFEATYLAPGCQDAVTVSLTDLVEAGYCIAAANGGEIPEDYDVEGRSRTFLLYSGEAVIVEKD